MGEKNGKQGQEDESASEGVNEYGSPLVECQGHPIRVSQLYIRKGLVLSPQKERLILVQGLKEGR